MAHQTKYPLTWPPGRPRSKSTRSSPFKVGGDKALQSLLEEVRMLGGTELVVSSNAMYRTDGMPYARQPYISDTGVAIYFNRKGKEASFACDAFETIHDNIRALALTVNAVRSMERYGTASLVDQVMNSFLALPPPIVLGMTKTWHETLGVPEDASVAMIQAAYEVLARMHHPDRGGDGKQMTQINMARDAALKERNG